MESSLPADKRKRLTILVAIGVTTSLYLVNHHVMANSGQELFPAICDINETFDCTKVARSPYSEFFGIPVASFGLLFYLLFGGLMVRPPLRVADIAWSWSLIGIVPTLFLALVSFTQIGAICLFCTVLYVLNVAMLFICAHLPGVRGNLLGSFTSGLEATLRLLVVPAVAVGVLVIGFGALALPQILEPPRKEDDANLAFVYQMFKKRTPSEELVASLKNDFLLGSRAAPVQVVAFSDYECPYCGRFAPIFKDLVKRYRGKVAFYFKHFPLSNICNEHITSEKHRFSCISASYTRCAGLQDPELFWKVHDGIFAMDSIDEDKLKALAVGLELDQAALTQCLNGEEVAGKIKNDIAIGKAAGVMGTPSVFINGRQLKELSPKVLYYFISQMIKDGNL